MANQSHLDEQAASLAIKLHEHDLDPDLPAEPNKLSSAGESDHMNWRCYINESG